MVKEMTLEELRALPVSVDLVTAARAFGIGRTKAFELVRDGEFPCEVLSVGLRFRVPRAALFRALGVDEDLATARRKGPEALSA